MKPKEYKTVMVCTDELLNQMSRDGWNIEHLQFDNGVLRGVFWRNAEAVKKVEVVQVVNAEMYRRPPMNIPYPQNLKRVSVDERIEQLDAELMEGLRQYWQALDNVGYVSCPLGQLAEVNP